MWVLRRLLCLVLLAQLAGAQTAARPKPTSKPKAAPPPNIILLTLDTTRADRMGFLGSQAGLTPNLDALAAQGVVFTHAYAQAPLTPVSHATMLTGTYPQFHHVIDFATPLPKNVPYAPDILRQRGYQTAAFVGAVVLDPVEGSAPGFDRGFDTYDAGFHIRGPNQDRYHSVERRAEDVVAHVLAWLDKHPRRPFFLWVHFYDAHDPYDPPEPFKSRYAANPYDGEIAHNDAVVGKFVAELRTRSLYDGTLLAVAADHGEALGEHGELTHGVFLYDETIHVPLLFKMPGGAAAGTRIDSRVGLVDILPTILQAVGVAIPKEVQGESLVGMMNPAKPGTNAASEAAKTADHPAYSETDYPSRAFGWSSMRALRAGKYLFIQAPRKELYDQPADPNAQHDLSASAAAVVDTLAAQLNNFRQKTSSSLADADQAVNPEQQEKLNALGYVGSDVKAGPGITDTGADPKDKIEIVNRLHTAIFDVEDARYREAIPILEEVLAKEPGIPIAYMQLATAFTWLREYEKALPILQKVVQMRPDDLMVHYQLGLALSETGNWEASVSEFEAAVAKSPNFADMHFSLAAAYGHVGRMAEARKELETTLTLKPDNYRANLILGRMLALQGKPADGLPNLKKAVKLQPNDINAHLFLADAYDRLGQKANAARERAEVERLKAAGGP